MSHYGEWEVHTFRDGEAELVHTVCRDTYPLLGRDLSLADLIHIADEHGCTGKP